MKPDVPHSRPSRRVDDPDGIDMSPVRAENKDIWAKAQSIYDHFKLAWMFWVGFGIVFTWAMINVVEPLRVVPRLQAQVSRQDTVNAANFDTVKTRLNHADEVRDDMAQVLKVFGKYICKQMSAEERYDYDIRCKDLPAPALKSP